MRYCFYRIVYCVQYNVNYLLYLLSCSYLFLTCFHISPIGLSIFNSLVLFVQFTCTILLVHECITYQFEQHLMTVLQLFFIDIIKFGDGNFYSYEYWKYSYSKIMRLNDQRERGFHHVSKATFIIGVTKEKVGIRVYFHGGDMV